MPDYEVIHRDSDLLVVAKPSGLPTTAPKGQRSLMSELSDSYSGVDMLHATSRLDLPVTGIVVVARTKRANERLLEARRRGRYRRLYLAISHERDTGDVHAAAAGDAQRAAPGVEGSWTWPISIDPQNRKLRTIGTGKATQDAKTHFVVRAAANTCKLLEVRPVTGRTHQIRVHAAAAGLPIFGDVQYGADKRITKPDGRVVAARRVMLHCARVDLPEISGDSIQTFEAPPPDDFCTCWTEVGGSLSSLETALPA